MWASGYPKPWWPLPQCFRKYAYVALAECRCQEITGKITPHALRSGTDTREGSSMTSKAAAGQVSTLWRYPVKSMSGEQVTESLVTEGGLLGDRGYAVIDQSNGKVASAKFPRKWSKLIELRAAFASPPEGGASLPPVRIIWPDGAAVGSDEQGVDASLTEMLGRLVTLTTTKPDKVSVERLEPLAEAEEILDIGALMMEGRFSDYAPLHLITSATLGRLSEIRPESQFDPRRFRPNLMIDTDDGNGFVENDWVGRTVAIGDDVRLRISDPTPRCSIPTLGQEFLAKDPSVLRTIVEHNRIPVPVLGGETRPCVGVYGFVLAGGTVRKGDPVRVE